MSLILPNQGKHAVNHCMFLGAAQEKKKSAFQTPDGYVL